MPAQPRFASVEEVVELLTEVGYLLSPATGARRTAGRWWLAREVGMGHV